MAKRKKFRTTFWYRFLVITGIYVLIGASFFSWAPFVSSINPIVIYVIAGIYVVSYIALVIYSEISYRKHNPN